MRLCFLAPANSVHSQRWIRFFAERGHEIHWISLNDPRFEPLPGVAYSFIPGRWAALPQAIIRVRRALERIKPDLLHIHSAGTYGMVGSLAMTGRKLPVVLSAWGSDVLLAGRHPLKRIFVRQALRRADVITVDAQHMVEAIAGMAIARNKIQIVNFGIETDRFQPDSPNHGLRRSYGLDPEDLAVISLRSLEPIYDIATFIRAAPQVRTALPNTRFIVAGDGSERRRLEALASELDVEDVVTFIGGYDHSTLPCLLNSMDAYVSTSLSDAGIAASTAEAMACGLPVVVSDSAENNLWIQDRKNGCLVPPSDAKALASALKWLLTNRDTARRLAAAGRVTILERNDYRREMGKVEQIYAGLAAREGFLA